SGDPLLRRLRLARQRDVAGCRLVPGRGDADDRLVDLLRRQPHRVEEGAVRRPLRPDRHMPARQARFVDAGPADIVGHDGSPRVAIPGVWRNLAAGPERINGVSPCALPSYPPKNFSHALLNDPDLRTN